ncbi:MAG TPA: FHA domain-containing protein [Gemmataceae bacterium]|nr:FHA domain-containing protein [Gemmataceae bacterium]
MSRDRDDKFDATRPTLIVNFGMARKYRPLDREVVVVGRAAGCDLCLEAPDVAPVHCVIVRAIDAWHVRDCTGRGGTRLNGQSVHDSALTDEDVVQIGSFSFALHLPPEERPLQDVKPAPNRQALQRAQRSRHHLAKLALRMRNKLAEKAALTAEQAEKQLASRNDELDRQTEELRTLQRDADARVAELKETAHQIAEERMLLQEQRGQCEAECAAKRAEAEEAARTALETARSHCRAMEAQQTRALEEERLAHEEAGREATRALEIRVQESACFAGYLRRLRGRLNEHEESLTARWEEWLREQQEASKAHAQQTEKIAREEALLRDQREEVVRLMGEMRQLRRKPDPVSDALRTENEQLRQDAAKLQEEVKELRGRLEQQAAAPVHPSAAEELHGFGVELHAGRHVLDEQIRDLQTRFAELERAAVSAEAHIASERIRLAQKRQEIERLCGGLAPADGLLVGGETVVDMPSPLRPSQLQNAECRMQIAE